MVRHLKVALASAVGLTVVGALVIAAARTPEASGVVPPSQSASASPSPGADAEVIPETTFLVRLDEGFRSLELPSGRLSTDVALGGWRDHVFRVTDDTVICVCTRVVGVAGSSGRANSVSVRWLSSSGQLQDELEVATFGGVRDGMTTHAALSEDRRLVHIAWAERDGDTWRPMVGVVDLERKQVVQTTEGEPVPARIERDGRSERVDVYGPTIALAPNGMHAVMQITLTPHRSSQETRWWIASVNGGMIGPWQEWEPDLGGACWYGISGFATDATYYAVCHPENWQHALLRVVDLEGTRTLDIDLGTAAVSTLLDEERSALIAWDPYTQRMARVDLLSGEVLTGPTDAGDGGDALLDRIMGWLVPGTRAKMMLEPGMALSPDGSRIYAIGLADSHGTAEILVVDADSLTVIDRWALDRAVTSVGLSRDGRYLFTAASPSWNAEGEVTGEASIAVYDTVDGSVTLRANDLSASWITFEPELMPAMPTTPAMPAMP